MYDGRSVLRHPATKGSSSRRQRLKPVPTALLINFDSRFLAPRASIAQHTRFRFYSHSSGRVQILEIQRYNCGNCSLRWQQFIVPFVSVPLTRHAFYHAISIHYTKP